MQKILLDAPPGKISEGHTWMLLALWNCTEWAMDSFQGALVCYYHVLTKCFTSVWLRGLWMRVIYQAVWIWNEIRLAVRFISFCISWSRHKQATAFIYSTDIQTHSYSVQKTRYHRVLIDMQHWCATPFQLPTEDRLFKHVTHQLFAFC